MKRIGILKNRIQEYAWGSRTSIAELLGKPSPSGTPQAELWMGAHPKAPSLVQYNDRWESLARVIANRPEEILGESIARRFDRRLPYLFKVLAAAEPLSIQAHPNLPQARQGFKREEEAGIAPTAPQRNYKDTNHKPECLCALTPFWALNGFRSIKEIIRDFRFLSPHSLSAELKELESASNEKGLKHFFKSLMSLSSDRKIKLIQETLKSLQKGDEEDIAYKWIKKLHAAYPNDIGSLAPLYLNLVCLEPGQAMFLQAGQLHSYLEGTGIELMANSDNVLRGGLTPKHVDVPELLNILDFTQKKMSILAPVKKREYEVVYESSAEEFVLSVICSPADGVYESPRDRSVEILLCTDGRALLSDAGGGGTFELHKGMSLLVPAAVSQYRIAGKVTVYKAAVPL